MDNVVQMPPPERPAPLLVGPFQQWRVQVDGRIIPRLTGYHDGDRIALVVDGRFSASFAEDDARQAAWLIAEAMAIAEGYSHLGAASKDHPFAPVGVELGSLSDVVT
jgi:hypothetical protein